MPEPLVLTLATSILLRMATAGIRVGFGAGAAAQTASGAATDDGLLGELAKSLTDTVEGMSSNAAHDYLKKIISGAESLDLDPATRQPRNRDLQRASCDALRGAAQALVWELAAQVQSGKPWLPSLQEHLKKGGVRRLFSEDAIGADPKRDWIEKLHVLIGGNEFESLHRSLVLAEPEIRACLKDTVPAVSVMLSHRFGSWARERIGAAGEPEQFSVVLVDGWRAGPEGPTLTLGLLYTHFLREYLKQRPEVFRVHVTDELSALRRENTDIAAFQRTAFASFDREFADVRGYLAAIEDQLGSVLRGQAELNEQLGQVLAALTTFDTAYQRGNPQAGEQLRRLSGLESQLDYLLGGIPLVRVPRPKALTKDTEFLMAQYRALPLSGRDAEMEALRSWLAAAPEISARLLIGAAGSGKTRMAIELLREVEDLRPHWVTGVLGQEALRRLVEEKDLTRLVWPHPTLVLVDYAQPLAEPLGKLLAALTTRAGEKCPPLRLLLLDRVAGPWFEQLLGIGEASSYSVCAVRKLFDPPHAIAVAPLPEGQIRRDLLNRALIAVARLQGKAAPILRSASDAPNIESRLREGRFGEPLQIAMAAVVACDRGLNEALACSRIDLALHVAQRERARLARFVAGEDGRLGQERSDLFCHLAACATLEHGFVSDELVRAVSEELHAWRCEWAGGNGALERLLREALPSKRLAVAPIEPDFVGEAFVLAELTEVREASGSVDRSKVWRETVSRCARRDPRATPATLLHAWQNFGHDARCSGSLLVATDALIALAEKDSAIDLFEGLAEAMPETSLEFAERALRLTRILYRSAKKEVSMETVSVDETTAKLSRHANNLAIRLGNLGQREEALVAGQEAVTLYRELAGRQPDAFRPDLATALNNVANGLSALGQREEALAAAQEAVALYRELAGRQPDAFRANLATALNNVAARLSALGQREEALVAGQEAVALYRELAERQPDAFRPNLAGSLNNVAARLSALGQREEALVAAQEAVALYRELAERQPDAFRPNLAGSLNNVAARLSELGQREEALATAQEAVTIRRELAERQPDAFRPDLAASLNNVAARMGALGQREEALATAQEAVALYRELAGRQPDAFRPNLAAALNNVAARLSALGQREEALVAGQEAVALYRELAGRQPDAFRSNLAASLNNMAARLSALGQREEALAAAQEAVALYRELAGRQPDAFRPNLAAALNNVANVLGALGRWAEALAAAQEAVALYRELAERQPDAFRPDLAASLNNVANRMGALGQREEALTAAQEAVALHRELAERQPDAFRPNLAAALNNVAARLSGVGHWEEALVAAQEAVALYRELAGRQPDAFRPDLATSLNNVANVLGSLGQREEALAAAQEAVALYRELAEQQSDAFRADLARSLSVLGLQLNDSERYVEAADVLLEAIATLLPFLGKFPEAFGPLFGRMLSAYFTACDKADSPPDPELIEVLKKIGLEPPENDTDDPAKMRR